MRIALLSDVHGNLPAFRAVLADVDSAGAERVWCLGDLVGYGAEPDGCVALARERCDVCLAGNHDLVVTGAIDIADFSASAAAAARVDPRAHLGRLARVPERARARRRHGGELGLYHASPRDPVWEYVLSTWQAGECMDVDGARAWARSATPTWRSTSSAPRTGRSTARRRRPAPRSDISEGEWLLNPGGVGQPRDGDSRAAWLLVDTDAWTATWRRVEYPIDEAAEAIQAAGLPAVLADRLYAGQ